MTKSRGIVVRFPEGQRNILPSKTSKPTRQPTHPPRYWGLKAARAWSWEHYCIWSRG